MMYKIFKTISRFRKSITSGLKMSVLELIEDRLKIDIGQPIGEKIWVVFESYNDNKICVIMDQKRFELHEFGYETIGYINQEAT